ncbi:unnamed protein product [Heligmosomoides polygyrus]|uniref:Neur_chan_memb domain-containing protein n=1 Tax=Heligmosomoides polygyrus TaxID=6339 RepID=A0A183FDW1_HELPZ|nr:unnamed protein product [Heligmosomoides polygyrus]
MLRFVLDQTRKDAPKNGASQCHLIRYNLIARVPAAGRHSDLLLQASVRDESLQRSNADFIKAYVVVFCISSILVAITEVALVRRMFRADSSRIRI